MVELQCKKASYRRWKQGCATKEKFRNTAQACRDGVCLEVMLPSDIRCNRKGFSGYIGSKRLNKENVSPLLNGRDGLVTVDTDKAEVGAAFASLQNLTLVLLSV